MALFLAASWRDQLERALFDNTFDGVHQLSWFDYSLLIPYFTILAVLAFYGVHRYEVMWLYRRARKNPAPAPARFEQLPRVTIQLPLYNERFVVEQLLESVSKVDWPHELLQIQVLDDSTDETHPFTERLVAEYRAQGLPIEYHHRTNRHGFKAGALEEGLQKATGEFVAVFDADFLIPSDFLHRTIHQFTDPKVGVVQTRWAYTNRHFNLLTEVQAMLLDGHFVLEHTARFGAGLFFNFNGTAGILRKRMIEDAGGWQHDTLTEDSDLSYRAQVKGWRFVYMPEVECLSELPVDWHGFQVQQARWAKGLTQVAIKLLRGILAEPLPWHVKLEAIRHLTPNLAFPLVTVLMFLILPVMMVRFYIGWQQLLAVDVPLLFCTFLSVIAFYIYTQKQREPKNWFRYIALTPVLLAAGVALALTNAKAVMEALFGVKTAFARTPKYAIAGTAKTQGAAPKAAKYRSKSGWLPFVELACGSWFAYICWYSAESYNFLAIPLMSVNVAGYYWAGFSTLALEVRHRLAWQRARKLEASRAVAQAAD